MALKGSLRLELIAKNITSEKLVDVGYPVFVAHTTKRSGNARSHTKKGQDEIRAEYPYAKKLDAGYSKENPAGMTKPTVDAIRKYINITLGK
jgi:hypothetical protein